MTYEDFLAANVLPKTHPMDFLVMLIWMDPVPLMRYSLGCRLRSLNPLNDW
jgi:hypothetical protein